MLGSVLEKKKTVKKRNETDCTDSAGRIEILLYHPLAAFERTDALNDAFVFHLFQLPFNAAFGNTDDFRQFLTADLRILPDCVQDFLGSFLGSA